MFGRKAKIRKAVARAFDAIGGGDDLPDDARAPIEALAAEHRPTAYFNLAHELVDDERYAAALRATERALELAPDEVDLFALLARIHRERGELVAAIGAQRRVVAANPRAIRPALALATMYVETGQAAQLGEAVDLLRALAPAGDREVDALLAEALFLRGEAEAAFELLDRVCGEYDAQLREPWSVPDRQGLIARAEHARRLRDDVYAELHGREATIELHAASGRLDARAGVNYRLLGSQLASKSERVAGALELEAPDATEQRGRALGETSAAGLALVGSAQLRRGDLRAARASFERASELDGRCFAAFFGLGAVLDHDKYGLHRRAERLPLAPAATPELARVVPDWPALTDVERRVAWASVGPFAAQLPGLAERGVQMRVLPIDVRATDIGLFEHVSGKRAADDHRSYDALGGVATQRGAIAKIEELLQIAADHSWTFAHELAHLVYYYLDDARTARFEAIYERARRVGYANIEYALKSSDEMFAVSYTDFVRARHGYRAAPVADDAGIQAALTSFFDELCE